VSRIRWPAVAARATEALRAGPLNRTQLTLLTHLRREGKSIRKIAAELGVSKSCIARHTLEIGPLKPRLPLGRAARTVTAQGYVYVFAAQTLVKVGMTIHSPYRRWHSIKTANPWLEPPLYVSPPLLARVTAIEKAAHTALKAYRVTGEWFECDRQLAIDTVQRLILSPSIGDGNVDRD
jgi:T5orf172 domain